jgi:DNA helicase-2/ATP-dependent DNA helicase PcrA
MPRWRTKQSFEGSASGSLAGSSVAVPAAVEAPFTVLLAGRLVRGPHRRIPIPTTLATIVVDWKTSGAEHANPLQLGYLPTAWASCEVPIDNVDAVFYDVRADRSYAPTAWPVGGELERLLSEPV